MPRRWRMEQEIAGRYMLDAKAGVTWDGEAVITGWYPLRDRYGHVRDSFLLRIVYPSEFLPLYPTVANPWCITAHPEVYLDSHHDVWVACADSHIFRSWRLCLYLPGESGIDLRRQDSLERIFESIATFLTRQRYFQRDLRVEESGGPRAVWPGPDRAHQEVGLWEAVQALGGLADNDPCVCGRPKPYGICCRPDVDACAMNLVGSSGNRGSDVQGRTG